MKDNVIVTVSHKISLWPGTYVRQTYAISLNTDITERLYMTLLKPILVRKEITHDGLAITGGLYRRLSSGHYMCRYLKIFRCLILHLALPKT